MEIDHYRPKRPFNNNQKKKYIKPKQAAAVEKSSQELPFWQYVRAQQIAVAVKIKHIQCWKCRRFEHFARDTWPGKLNRSSCVETNKKSHEHKNVKIVNIYIAGSPNSTLIKVNNQRFRSLVDTGTELCLVNSNFFHALPSVAKLKKNLIFIYNQ